MCIRYEHNFETKANVTRDIRQPILKEKGQKGMIKLFTQN